MIVAVCVVEIVVVVHKLVEIFETHVYCSIKLDEMQDVLDVDLDEIHNNIYVFSSRLCASRHMFSTRFYHELIRMSSPYKSCVGLGVFSRPVGVDNCAFLWYARLAHKTQRH